MIPVILSNRIGTEIDDQSQMTFYGSSFIADETGAIIAQADRVSETILTAEFDLDQLDVFRSTWGTFRDRRPNMYEPILHKDFTCKI